MLFAAVRLVRERRRGSVSVRRFDDKAEPGHRTREQGVGNTALEVTGLCVEEGAGLY
jgi:hypothetical protein